jgi:putative DNA primase/helicase
MMPIFFGPDVDVAQLDELLPELDQLKVARFVEVAEGDIIICPEAKLPDRFEVLLAKDHKFCCTWERRRPDLKDQSLSGYEMSLASIAANAGGTAQEICDILVTFRKKFGGHWHGRSYYRSTVGKALGNAARHRRAEPREEDIPPAPPAADEGEDQGEYRGGDSPFELRNDGVWFISADPDTPPRRVCGPLEVTACTRNSASENWGRCLRWRDPDGHEHVYWMPMSLLAGDGREPWQVLLDGGLFITPGRYAHERLALYIQHSKPAERVRSVDRVGWDDNAYVLPDISIGPGGGDKVVYQTASGTEHYYRVGGTMAGWKRGVGAKCSGNSRLLFVVSTPFGAVLIGPLGIEGGGIHIVGDTSEGKTTLLVIAGSVMGGGGPRGFVRTWRATDNALEAVAELANDSLLPLDEIRELPDPADGDRVAYMLANGAGKSRLSASIKLRQTMQWRLLFLSSGEIKLSEYVALAKRGRSRGGAEVRLLNIPADAGKGKGVFENLHGADSPAAFADQLVASAKENYGHPIRTFLAWLVSNPNLLTEARQMMEEFVEKYLPQGAAPEIGRALRRFAVVAVGGELATRAGITGWRPGEAEQAAKKCFQAWLSDRTGSGAFEKEEAIAQVRMFLEAHGASRFESSTTRYDKHQNPIVERVPNRAGYWRECNEGKEYLVFGEVFRREVCAGFNYKSVAAELHRLGHLKRNPPHWTLKVNSMPEGTRFFCVQASIFEGPETRDPETTSNDEVEGNGVGNEN